MPEEIMLGQVWRTYGTRKDFLRTRHSLLFQFFIFFIFLPEQCPYMCTNTHTRLRRDCIWINKG